MAKHVTLVRPEYKGTSYVRAPATSKTVPRVRGKRDPSKEGVPTPPPSLGANEQEKINVVGLLKLADQLSSAERQQVLAHLALKAQTAEINNPRDVEMWAQAVYAALQTALGGEDRGLGGPHLIKRFVGAPSAWRSVDEFMQASKLADLKVMERQQVYGLLAELVVDHARSVSKHSKAPLGPKLVSNCAANLAGLFERAFPGYLAAGLASVVARQVARGL